ncbi:hypothetical protein P3T25_008905 [Paraburkholderia sp. GAS32]
MSEYSENVGATLKADAKATKVVESYLSALYCTAKLAKHTVVLGPALCDHRLDVASAKFRAAWFGVVAAIDANNFGRLERPDAYIANRRNGVDERQQLSNVVAVCAR